MLRPRIAWRTNLHPGISRLSTRGNFIANFHYGKERSTSVTELVLVGSGSYEQSWRAIPTQRPGPECYTRNRLKVQGSGKSTVTRNTV